MKRIQIWTLQLILTSLICVGCQSDTPAPPVSSADQKIEEIVKKSSGKWDSLTENDRAILIQELGKGNEQTAKMAFEAKVTSGGPPIPGPR
jgi:hypothetical protein